MYKFYVWRNAADNYLNMLKIYDVDKGSFNVV